MVAFAFFGMNAVGVEIENPFGDDDNDLPVKKMMQRVELDTAAMLKLHEVSEQVEEVTQRRAQKRKDKEAAQKKLDAQKAGGSNHKKNKHGK